MENLNTKTDSAVKAYIEKRYEDDITKKYRRLYDAVKETGQPMDSVSEFTPEIGMAHQSISDLLHKIRTDIKLYFKIDDSEALKKYIKYIVKIAENSIDNGKD